MEKKTLVLMVLLTVGRSNVTQINFKDTTKYKSTAATVTTDLPTTSEFATETDFNISFSNTTTVPTTAPNGTSPPTSTTTQIPMVDRHEDSSSCLCDLRRRACDIGCCCDEDCTYEDKRIFERCDAIRQSNVDRSACEYTEVGYVNFTVRGWEIQNNDLFCVAKTNLPPSYAVQKEKPFKNYADIRLEKRAGDFWPHRYHDGHKQVNFSEPYVQAVPLKLVLDNSTLGIFRLSESFFTSGCNLQSDITFLNNFESQCVHLLNEDNNFLDADYYGKILFIARPEILNVTLLENQLMTCASPVCLKPYVKICTDVHLRNCRDADKKVISFRCQTKQTDVICVNIVDALKFVIFHNGTGGVKNISLSLHLTNATRRLDVRQYGITQKLSVVYEWSSLKTNYSEVLSGNPGYLIGRPILVGTVANGTIRRYPRSYRDNFMVLPYEDAGICQIGEYSYQPIEFGYSTILFCKIEGSLSAPNASNPAGICKRLQKEILAYWDILEVNGYFRNRSFGLFGNAITSMQDDWREIVFEKSAKELSDGVTGKISNKNTTLTCYGLVFGLNIDIFHAKVDIKKLVDQEKILGISYQFHSSSNRSSIFKIRNRSLAYEFDLDTRVAFWDKTSQKLRRLVDPPSLNIKLPSDFFYPFVKMGNAGVIMVPKFVSVLLFSLFRSLVISIS